MTGKIELLAPAGNMEKLKAAVHYGADAVYFGGRAFGLRAFSDNFTVEELAEAVDYLHARGKKGYLTLNVFPRNDDIGELKDFLGEIRGICFDGFICSDFGLISLVRETCPDIPVHVSTQANILNYLTADFWKKQGAERIVLARELSREEINAIADAVDIELEIFVHGAMCISYSGRCLLSSYMTGRDANKGECAQPCRWNYSLVEEKRPGEYYPVFEDDRGSYVFNSMDLCLFDRLDEIRKMRIASLKIEGRMKSSYYTAVTVRAYRKALDFLKEEKTDEKELSRWKEELYKVSHRPYTEGFFVGGGMKAEVSADVGYVRPWQFMGVVLGYDSEKGVALVEQRNLIEEGDVLEAMTPDGSDFTFAAAGMIDADTGKGISRAPHPRQKILIPCTRELLPGDMLRCLK